jgi:hypothetical protein
MRTHHQGGHDGSTDDQQQAVDGSAEERPDADHHGNHGDGGAEERQPADRQRVLVWARSGPGQPGGRRVEAEETKRGVRGHEHHRRDDLKSGVRSHCQHNVAGQREGEGGDERPQRGDRPGCDLS